MGQKRGARGLEVDQVDVAAELLGDPREGVEVAVGRQPADAEIHVGARVDAALHEGAEEDDLGGAELFAQGPRDFPEAGAARGRLRRGRVRRSPSLSSPSPPR